MRRPLLIAAALCCAAGLSGCAAQAPAAPAARVVVRVAPSAPADDYEVQVAQASGPFRAAERLRPGQEHSFAVPAGWLTVRVPGHCVVPAAASGTTTVAVERTACRIV